MNSLTIQGIEMPITEYNGQRVVSFAMIDEVHQRPEGTARRNFTEHSHRCVYGEDFFEVTADEIRSQSLSHIFPPRTSKGILITESGYLLLVKSFKDDLAWDVQRKLVNAYFKPKAVAPSIDFTDSKFLIEALTAQASKALALESKVQELTPKAQFHDAVAEAINAQTISDAAKALGTGEVRLFRWLREFGFLMTNNRPYQKWIEQGLFRVVEKKRNDPSTGESLIYTQTLITGKGVTYIQPKLGEARNAVV